MENNREKTLLIDIHDTAKLFKDYIRRSSDRVGINSTYHRIMGAINRNGSVTQRELVETTHLKAPTISLMLKNMELEGIVKREIDENDLRSTKISFTKKGEELCKDNIEFIVNKEKEIESCISDEERKVVFEVLEKLQKEIKKKNENI